MHDWSKWFIFGKKPYSGSGPIIRYQGRKIIVIGALAVALIPAVAYAKGPIVRATETIWNFLAAAFGF